MRQKSRNRTVFAGMTLAFLIGHFGFVSADQYESDADFNVPVVRCGESIERQTSVPAELRRESAIVFAKLRKFPGGNVVWADEIELKRGQSEVIFGWTTPSTVGVYQYEVTLKSRDPHARWWPKTSSAEQNRLHTETLVVRKAVVSDAEATNQHLSARTTGSPIDPRWQPQSTIDPLTSSSFVDAWQTIRHSVQDNSWFDITLPWSTGTEKNIPLLPEATASRQRKLSSVESPYGTLASLPAGEVYQCPLPPTDDGKLHRLTVSFDASVPAHFNLSWFCQGQTEPADIQRIDHLPELDAPDKLKTRSFIYRATKPGRLQITNLDRSQALPLGKLVVEVGDEALTSPMAAKTFIAADDGRLRHQWFVDIPWSTVMSSTFNTSIGDDGSWSDRTRSVGRFEDLLRRVRFQTLTQPTDRTWIEISLSDLETDELVVMGELIRLASRTDPSIEFVTFDRKLWDTLRSMQRPVSLLIRETEQAHLIGVDADADVITDSRPLIRRYIDSDHEESFAVVARTSSADPPSADLMFIPKVVQRMTLPTVCAGLGADIIDVAAEAPMWSSWFDIWQQCTADINSFESVESVDPNNQFVDVFRDRDGRWILINHAPWRASVHIRWRQKLESDLDLVGPGNVVGHRDTHSELRLEPNAVARLSIHAAGQSAAKSASTAAVSSPATDIRIRSWSAVVEGGVSTVEEIKSRVTRAVERVGMLREPPLEDDIWRNDFSLLESSQTGDQATSIAPWLCVQHPVDAVKPVLEDGDAINASRKETASGERSSLTDAAESRCVELTCHPQQTGRTWIVSPTFDADAGGSLAVSLRCRGVHVDQDHGQADAAAAAAVAKSTGAGGPSRENPGSVTLRVSLEAIEAGQPIRLSRIIDVPVQQTWRTFPLLLQSHGWVPSQIESLRLTIDLMSAGVVRIDDVRVHRRFATSKERESLQKLAFLAVQGLKRGNLSHSSVLLGNPHVDALLFRPEYQSRDHSLMTDAGNDILGPTSLETTRSRIGDSTDKEFHSDSGRADRDDDDSPPSVSSRLRKLWPQSLRF